MISRSTGPPGTNCMITNTASVIPMKVGMISSNRRMKYAVTSTPNNRLPRRAPVFGTFGVVLPVTDVDRSDRQLDGWLASARLSSAPARGRSTTATRLE